MQAIIDEIRSKKEYPKRHEQGSVMILTNIKNYPRLDDINIYYPKHKNHFWLGICINPHATIHHGFNLEKYKSKKEWEEDVRKLMPKNMEDDDDYVSITPHWFPSNLPDEDKYYFVVGKFEPTEKMKQFRQNLLATFPHISTFPTWSPHVSIASVADENSRDILMERIKNMKIKYSGLQLGGFNEYK